MKKILLLLAVAVAALSIQAAPVDKVAAQKVAKNYLANELYAGKMMAPAATTPVLIKTEYGSDKKLNQPVYYIYNTSTTFLVVSGDDRAEEILMVGDKPLNMDRIPDGLQYLLDCYKEQMDFLQANPTIVVEKPSQQRNQLRATTYGPLLTAEWDQSAPYNNLCKFTYNNRTYTCMTGCPATSAAMVFYYWKYPTSQIPALASYTSTLDIGSYYSNEVSYTYPALEATTFDWGNMKDKYTGSYTNAQRDAVATLMRYIGQAEQMMYGVTGSGIYTNETQKVVNMFKNWGYSSSCAVKYKSSYSETNWANLIIGELAAGRPLIYNGVSGNEGHAFNVDGYRDSDSKYHVNFGWSGDGNNWYAMNAFTYSGYTFSSNQQAVIGIQPPGGQVTTPELHVTPSSLAFEATAGSTVTKTFTVTAENLYSDVTIAKSGNSYFTVSPTTLTKEQAMAGATVTVTYNPAVTGSHAGTITVSSSGVLTNPTVSLTGTSTTAVPVITPSATSLSFSTQAGTAVTKTYRITAANLTGSIRLTASGTGFSVSPAVILKSNAALSSTGVEVTVTYNPTEAGNHTGTITMTSDGAETKTVTLTGTATEPPRAITVNPSSLTFNTNTETPVTQTFTVTGTNLTGPLTLSFSGGNGTYTITPTTLTVAQAQAGATVTVTYAPTAAGTHNATVTVSGGGASSKTVSLNGTATLPVRTITVNPSTLTFNTLVGEMATQTFTVTGENLNSNVTLTLNDPNGVYTFSPATLTAAQAMAGATVTVNHAPTTYGNQNATITISGGGADAVTVNLNGVATFVKYAPVMLPANETYISLTQFRADWTDQTADENVASYTLEVSPKVVEPVLLHSLSGSAYTGNSYNDITLPAPWSGVNVRGGNNAIYIKNNYNNVAQGYIKYTIPEGYTNATFTVMVTSQNSATDGIGDVTVSTPQTAAVSHNFSKNETYYWVVTASSGEQITMISNDASYSPNMTLIAVYSGDARPSTLMANETGNETYRLIENITEKYYTVKNLAEAGTFLYRVKALYMDGTESDWSNIEEVTLFENAHPYGKGDVNHDSSVDINDVTVMIDYVLNGGEICMICADLNGDEICDINDVTTLIDWVLNGVPATLMGMHEVILNVER